MDRPILYLDIVFYENMIADDFYFFERIGIRIQHRETNDYIGNIQGLQWMSMFVRILKIEKRIKKNKG